MANAANSPFVKHPALLALFAPRPPPTFKAPINRKSAVKLSGIAQLTHHFLSTESAEAVPQQTLETLTERRERVKKEKEEAHKKVLAEREKKWDPYNNPNATKDPYKTLFVARLSYELNEADLRREFERYGRIKDVKLIKDKESDKSRGYAFIEFERSNDYKDAFQHADGHKLKGRRILVDVERGRTVKTWRPRKLGGGLGKTRAGPSEKQKDHTPNNSNNNYGSNRSNRDHRDRQRGDRDRHQATPHRDRKRENDKYSSRDRRDRDKPSSSRKKRDDRKGDRNRNDRDNNHRSRSRDRKDRKRGRDRGDKEKERDRTDRGDKRDGNSRKDAKKEKDRTPRRHRSRSKEKTRRR